MNVFKEELDKEMERIREGLKNGQTLSTDDLKTVLLHELYEEESHERR